MLDCGHGLFIWGESRTMKGSTPLAETLARLMEEQRLNAKSLAVKAKVARSTLGGWLSGVQPHDLNDVKRVAHALGCTFEYLVFGEEDRDLARAINGAARSIVLEGVYRIKIESIEGTMNDTP